MDETTEELYFNWLCTKVLGPRKNIYEGLLSIFHGTEYVWVLQGDKNRAEDGLELRYHFVNESRISPDTSWDVTGCSIFEMLLALANRAEFQTHRSARDWFWIFVQNLGLDEHRVLLDSDVPYVEGVLYQFVWREYDDNGNGGIFPMRWPKEDQRGLEIWYQLHAYLAEKKID